MYCKNLGMFFLMRFQYFLQRETLILKLALPLGATPMSKTPYMMSTPELLELKMQLQELREKKYIRQGVSPWGAPIWFEKEKEYTGKLCIDYRHLNVRMKKET